jgi:hypothetical protein
LEPWNRDSDLIFHLTMVWNSASFGIQEHDSHSLNRIETVVLACFHPPTKLHTVKRSLKWERAVVTLSPEPSSDGPPSQGPVLLPSQDFSEMLDSKIYAAYCQRTSSHVLLYDRPPFVTTALRSMLTHLILLKTRADEATATRWADSIYYSNEDRRKYILEEVKSAWDNKSLGSLLNSGPAPSLFSLPVP